MSNTPTRRLFLATGSAAAVFGALSQSVAAAEDPIFAAIAEYERAKVAAQAATDTVHQASEAYENAKREIGLVIYKGEEIDSIGRLDFVADGERGKEYFKAHEALEARAEAYQKAWRDFRVHELDEAATDVFMVKWKAQTAVIETQPATQVGAIALLCVLAERLDDDNEAEADVIRNALAVLKRGEA
jgi:hypothetical protein